MQDQALIQRHLHGFEFVITSCFLILFRGSFLFYAMQFRRREKHGVLGTVVYLTSNFLSWPRPHKRLVLAVVLGNIVCQFEHHVGEWRFEKEIPVKLGTSSEKQAKTQPGVNGLGRNCKWWD